MRILYSNIIGEAEKELIILHGFLGMGDNWKTLSKKWASVGFKVHLIDQRNHGRSFWSESFSYKILAEDVINYCDHHKLSEVYIIGHSMGGKTAMNLAILAPQLLKAFIVADIAPKKYVPHHQQLLNGLAQLDFTLISNRSEASLRLSPFVKDEGTRMFLLRNLYWISPGKLGLRLNIEVLKNVSETISEGLDLSATSLIPCLFVKGEKSDYILETDYPIIQHHFPKADHILVPKAGHWLHSENPIFFFDQVNDWLQQQ